MAPLSITAACASLLLLLSYPHPAHTQASFQPKTLVKPVTKEATTLQYVIQLDQKTPLQTLKLVVDLGGSFPWIDCNTKYESSSYHPVSCLSELCSAARTTRCGICSAPRAPGCYSHSCGVYAENTVTHISAVGHLIEDLLVFNFTNGKNSRLTVSFPRYVFACTPASLLNGLTSGVNGMAGLGRNRISLPTQLAEAFSFHRQFAICLASSQGVIFFGDGPYVLLPGVDASANLTYTSLLVNSVSTTAGVSTQEGSSDEYFIGVKSIKINEKQVPLNSTLLSFDSKGVGGTKISTVVPYTTLENSIFNAVIAAFIREATAMNISRVAAVKPFGVCFNSKNVGSTRAGPAVPTIDLVLQSSTTLWRIFGSNSMVHAKRGVLCLGLLDGGVNPRTSIVIGGHQLENNLLKFDLSTSTMGFSSSLLFRKTTCANFNFTSSV